MTEESYWNRKVADQLAEMNNLLRALVTINLANMKMTMFEKVELLYRGGFTPSEIAAILGTTANSVSVMLSKLRKSAEKIVKQESPQKLATQA